MSTARRKDIIMAAISLFFAAVLLFAWLYGRTPPENLTAGEGELVLQVLNVGQGDSLILSCAGETMLIDAGVLEQADTVIKAVARFRELKYAAATHPHGDHIGALYKVLEKYPPEKLLLPQMLSSSDAFLSLLGVIEKKEIEAEYAFAGLSFRLGEAEITVLSPEKGFQSDNENNGSLVFLVEFCGKKLLLTGDAESEQEALFASAAGKVDLLKAGHHGASGSTTEVLLEAARPDAVIISCGAGNDYGHPHAETLARLEKYGCRVYRTDQSGTVTVRIDESGMQISCEN